MSNLQEGTEPTPPSATQFRRVATLGRPAVGDEVEAVTNAGEHVAVLLVNGDARLLGAYRDVLASEGERLARLRHPGLVAPVEVLELDGRVAVVTELVGGADLDHVVAALELRGAPFPLRAALEVGAQVADALRAAHTAEVRDSVVPMLHRDVKPSNVRIGTSGRARLVQFGVARGAIDEDAAAAGLTPSEAYLAPERILGAADTPAGDVFAVALTVIDLIIGRPLGPTPGVPGLHEAWVDEVLDLARRAAIGQGHPPLPVAEVVATLRRGLDLRPTDRPSAAEFANHLDILARRFDRSEDLAAFTRRFLPNLDHLLGRIREPADGILVGAPASLPPPTPTLAPPDRSVRRAPPRSSALVLATGLGIVAIAAMCAGITAYETAAVLHDHYGPSSAAQP